MRTTPHPNASAPAVSQSQLSYATQPSSAIYSPGSLATPLVLDLMTPAAHQRHQGQLRDNRIEQLNTKAGLIIDARHYCECYRVDATVRQNSQSINGEIVFQPHLYLFNLILAFEWNPSPQYIQRIQIAVKKASNVLYDVTDGFMAIGQAILADRSLLDVADIQIMASNRFHPRSWNSAVLDPNKYQPIRLGRGLWRKDQGFVMPWDESDAHRVLVHELGHYALGLVDEYLDLVLLTRTNSTQRLWNDTLVTQLTSTPGPNKLNIVAPSISLPVESIMSTITASELVPRHDKSCDARRKHMFKKLQSTYTHIQPNSKALEGPAELPVAELPVFVHALASGAPEEVVLEGQALDTLRSTLLANGAQLIGSPWVYVLLPDGRIVAQGVLGKHDWDTGFTLLAAVPNAQIVVIAQTSVASTNSAQLRVLSANILPQGQISAWSDATPSTLPAFVDVLPDAQAGQPILPTHLRVQLETRGTLPQVFVGALGEARVEMQSASQESVTVAGETRTRWISTTKDFQHLDGHVLLSWNNGQQLYICGYSHGGGPCTSGGGRCICYTAGSYEGNSMMFFLGNYDASDRPQPRLNLVQQQDEGMRIVSTVLHGGEQMITTGPNTVAEARSYVFSLASGQKIDKNSASLVLYYDQDTPKKGGDLLIYRWDDTNGWRRLSTYAPSGQSFVCIPLDQQTPECINSQVNTSGHYINRYRIYWTPSP